MGDRAQYFLEQSLPELLDLQEKKVFSPLEIKAIARKRTQFEHALTRKIIRKADYLRYAEYEMNLEALRRQRVKRLQIKGKRSISDWAGPRRIFFIFERATKRFHGDVDLWLQYIEYAKQEKSNKVLGKAYTSLLQFHPTNAKLWILAGTHELDWNGNMSAARTLMQRGLRLNTDSSQLWLEYFRLELTYLDKVYARRRILGLEDSAEDVEREETLGGLEDDNSEHIKLPKITQAELDGDVSQQALLKDVELSALSTSSSNAALQGAIPMAIVRAAIKALPRRVELLIDFYNIMATYQNLPCRNDILSSIVDLLSSDERRNHPDAQYLRIVLPMSLLNDDVTNPDFPAALKQSLSSLSATKGPYSVKFTTNWTKYLLQLLQNPTIDSNLRRAVCLVTERAFQQSRSELTVPLYQAWITFKTREGDEELAAALLGEAQAKFGREHIVI